MNAMGRLILKKTGRGPQARERCAARLHYKRPGTALAELNRAIEEGRCSHRLANALNKYLRISNEDLMIARVKTAVEHIAEEKDAARQGKPTYGYLKKHRTTRVYAPFMKKRITVDLKIAPLLEAMWRLGIRTVASCEEARRGCVYLCFPRVSDMQRFLVAVFPKADDFYCRRARAFSYSGGKAGWYFEFALCEVTPTPTAELELEVMCRLHFSQEDSDEVLRRVEGAMERMGRLEEETVYGGEGVSVF
jgi:hypothetical protein